MRGLREGKLLLGRFRATIPWLAKLRRAPYEQRGYRVGLEVRLTGLCSVKRRKHRQRAIWKGNAEGYDKPQADRVVGLGIVHE
jgi:ribosome modulation factor